MSGSAAVLTQTVQIPVPDASPMERAMNIRNVLIVLASALGLAPLATACATQPHQPTVAERAQPTSSPNSQTAMRPTIVLLHGAFEDASSWRKVTEQLQAAGFPVIAPAVQLRGVASDTAAVEGVINAIQGPKVLVGHSYGGLLVSELADKTPHVTALVYVAALIPEAGETATQLNFQFAGSLFGPATTHLVGSPGGPEIYVNMTNFQEVFAAGGDPAEAEAAAAGQRPVLAAAFDEKVATTAPAQIRKYAIVALADKAIPPAAERFEARRSGAIVTEVRSPHAVPVTNPQAVVDVIQQAAGQ